MIKYLRNIKHVLKHKFFVLIECWKKGLYIQGIIHDLSKFSPTEFYAYSWHFFADNLEKAYSGDKYEKLFQYAWLHH